VSKNIRSDVTRLFGFGILFAILFILGWIEQILIDNPQQSDPRWYRYLFPFQRDGFVQVGGLGVIGVVAVAVLRGFSTTFFTYLIACTKSLIPKICLVIVIFFVVGEILLRIIFWDGMSFSNHFGPICRRFERNFVFNKYEGPSRGPEVNGPKKEGWVRVLVQGDSITWGQGVKHEHELYTNRLLRLLRVENPQVEVASLSTGGREIDDHLEQLHQYGVQVDPDVIVYQWYVNDLELRTKRNRPSVQQARLPWQRLFFYNVLRATSYFWFYLDYQTDRLRPALSRSYEEYLLETFGSDTPSWREFESIFRKWAVEAKRHTPRVLVLLYPYMGRHQGFQIGPIHEKVRRLCREIDIETIEFIDELGDWNENRCVLFASPYDGHPSERVHELIAISLHKAIRAKWSDLFRVEIR